MSPTTEKLFRDALELPEKDRAALAGLLIDSLEPETDEDVEAAWDAEIQRRVAELDARLVKTVPWSVARRMILGEHHEPVEP